MKVNLQGRITNHHCHSNYYLNFVVATSDVYYTKFIYLSALIFIKKQGLHLLILKCKMLGKWYNFAPK